MMASGTLGTSVMRRRYLHLLALGAAALSSCQDYSRTLWVPMVANTPPAPMAFARCQIMARSVDQGYIAFGSQSYVAGAAIGNALGNAMRENQFIGQCMVASGFRPVQAGNTTPPDVKPTKPTEPGHPFPPKPKALK